MTNSEQRVLDEIAALEHEQADEIIAQQLRRGPIDDYNADLYDKCTHCRDDWHGLTHEYNGCPGMLAGDDEIEAWRQARSPRPSRRQRDGMIYDEQARARSGYTFNDLHAILTAPNPYLPGDAPPGSRHHECTLDRNGRCVWASCPTNRSAGTMHATHRVRIWARLRATNELRMLEAALILTEVSSSCGLVQIGARIVGGWRMLSFTDELYQQMRDRQAAGEPALPPDECVVPVSELRDDLANVERLAADGWQHIGYCDDQIELTATAEDDRYAFGRRDALRRVTRTSYTETISFVATDSVLAALTQTRGNDD